MLLRSYAAGSWVEPADEGRPLFHAVTGEEVARISSAGVDAAAMLGHARAVGGPALRAMTIHQRALILRDLAKYLSGRTEELYDVARATGDVRSHAWYDIDGGVGVLFTYASKGRRELPNAGFVVDGPPEILGKKGTFAAQHVWQPLRGAAVQINAFNFPVWGALEKFAPAFLAGVPTIVKPASPTAYLAERLVSLIVESGLLPAGSLQLLCGSAGDLLDHLGPQDVVLFTGSGATAAKLRTHPTVVEKSVRFNAECDSLNACVLGPDAAPGTSEFDLFVNEVVTEMTTKAGQRCTAIRRAIVPSWQRAAVVEALAARLADVVVGDPADEAVTMGALASREQRDEVRGAVARLRNGARLVTGNPDEFADAAGAFLPPLLLVADDARAAEPHTVEAFGPVSTVVGYADAAEAARLVGEAGGGSLVASAFTADSGFARDLAREAGPWLGRLLVVDASCAAEQTGHGSPLPHLVHGGPGRAGGGEEQGGVRSVFHFMQRTAVQGSPATLTAVTDRWMPGAPRRTDGPHPFRVTLDELSIGDALVSAEHLVTVEEIEAFADLTGDHFYAHMDDALAAANPFFDGRVAHGYLVVALAAGLFVDPDPGPVLANYGLDDLRFVTPVYPGDRIRVTLTCKEKNPRATEPYGEVRWDACVTNQDDKVCAQYDVLTLVATTAADPRRPSG